MSLPPDLLAALQGGGGAPPMGPQGGMPMGPEGMGAPQDIPPDMLAALQGGGGMPMMEEAPEGGLHGGSVAPGDPAEAYRGALDALEMGIKSDTDEQRIQVMMKAGTAIQGALASSQSGVDAALGGKLDPAMMRQMSAPDQAY